MGGGSEGLGDEGDRTAGSFPCGAYMLVGEIRHIF